MNRATPGSREEITEGSHIHKRTIEMLKRSVLPSFLCLVLIGEVCSQSGSSCCDSFGNPFGQFTGEVFQDNAGISFPVVVDYSANGVIETHLDGLCGNDESIVPKSVGSGTFTWDRDFDYGLDVCVLTGTSTLTKSANASTTWDYYYINRDGTLNDGTLSGTLAFIPSCSGGCSDDSPSQAPPSSTSDNAIPSQEASPSSSAAATKEIVVGFFLFLLLDMTLLVTNVI